MTRYLGKCQCGTIEFQCEGEPLFTQYCHCNKCREVMAQSQRAEDRQGYAFTAAYLTNNFKITKGEDQLEDVIRNHAKLLLCPTCQSQIYGISLDPALQAGIGINANNFVKPLSDAFKPVRHIWYLDRVVDFNDNLPKFKDAPKEQGGSGEMC